MRFRPHIIPTNSQSAITQQMKMTIAHDFKRCLVFACTAKRFPSKEESTSSVPETANEFIVGGFRRYRNQSGSPGLFMARAFIGNYSFFGSIERASSRRSASESGRDSAEAIVRISSIPNCRYLQAYRFGLCLVPPTGRKQTKYTSLSGDKNNSVTKQLWFVLAYSFSSLKQTARSSVVMSLVISRRF